MYTKYCIHEIICQRPVTDICDQSLITVVIKYRQPWLTTNDYGFQNLKPATVTWDQPWLWGVSYGCRTSTTIVGRHRWFRDVSHGFVDVGHSCGTSATVTGQHLIFENGHLKDHGYRMSLMVTRALVTTMVTRRQSQVYNRDQSLMESFTCFDVDN